MLQQEPYSETCFPRDTDDDGMPDSWEAHYSAGPTNMSAEADGDRDGMRNLHECIAGTDPQDSNSVLQIAAIVQPQGRPSVHWDSVTNRWYAVERCSNLLERFLLIATNIPATPPTNVYNDDVGEREWLFYRIEVKP